MSTVRRWPAVVAGAALMLAAGAALGQTPPAAPPMVPAFAGAQGIPEGNYNAAVRSKDDLALANPYSRNEAWFTVPDGLLLGSASGIAMDRDGKSVWLFERCTGQDYCIGSDQDPIWKFDASGKVVAHFGKGMFVYPHGLHVDRDGNLWLTDLRTNTHQQGNQSAKQIPGAKPDGAKVVKLSPTGKVLLTLGTPGVYGDDATHLSQPSAVITAPNGDIFVADGHDSPPVNNRIVKYDRTGKFLKAWSSCQPGDRTNDCSHALAMDSQGRLFVANRGNSSIDILDQDGKLLARWKQFGKPSGLAIDRNDVLYAVDTMSGVRDGNAYIRGLHVGSAKTGQVTGFTADPLGNPAPWSPLRGTSGGEGVAVAADGTVYISQVTPPGLAKLTRKTWKTGQP